MASYYDKLMDALKSADYHAEEIEAERSALEEERDALQAKVEALEDRVAELEQEARS